MCFTILFSRPSSVVSLHYTVTAPALVGGGRQGGCPLNNICPPARGLARHNKRFTIEEIIKIVATRCQILRLNCTEFDFGWGFAPDPAWGAYSATPDPLAGF